MRVLSTILFALVIATLGTRPGVTSEAMGLNIELNALESPQEGATAFCRLYFLIRNDSLRTHSAYLADLFILDSNAIIAGRATVDFGPIPPQKTRVAIFDIPGVRCTNYGTVLLNAVTDCPIPQDAPEEGRPEACLDDVRLSSKTDAAFIQ